MRRGSIAVIAAGLGLLQALASCQKGPGGAPDPSGPRENALSRISLTDAGVRNAGLKTGPAEVRTFSSTLSAVGVVAFNRKKYVVVTPRIGGRIEEVRAFEGERVKPGQEIFSLYSADFLAAQAEYLQILGRPRRAGDLAAGADDTFAGDMLASAENKLKLMGLEDPEMEKIRREGRAVPLLIVRSPIAGTVVESRAVAGGYAEAGTPLFDIADLSRVWVDAQVYEKDLSSVVPGSGAVVEVAAFPGQSFPGVVDLIGPVLDETTRTAKARIDVGNPSGKLRPGMFASLRIASPATSTVLAIPESALRKIAGKMIVFVEEGERTYAPREVETGRNWEGFVEILKGLRPGDIIVTEGSVSLKAEMLKGALEEES